jgi:hypothetical protein
MPRLLASAWRQNRISGRCWRAKYCRPSIGSVKRYSARSALPGRTLFYHANRPFESDPWKITLACGSHQPCRPATIGIFNTADWCVSNYRGNLPCSRAMRVSRRLGEGATSSNRHLREGSPAHCRGYATPASSLRNEWFPFRSLLQRCSLLVALPCSLFVTKLGVGDSLLLGRAILADCRKSGN